MDDEELSGDEQYARRGQARLMQAAEGGDAEDEDDPYANANDYAEVRGPLSEWLRKKPVILYVQKAFGVFLRSFANTEGVHVYESRITQMC